MNFTLVLLALAAGFGIYAYLSLKVELRLMARRGVTRPELEARLHELVAELESLRLQLAAAQARPAPAAEWTAQAVNLNRRGQILRLHGKGRTAAEIASDLQISQGEVELMVKVHDWRAPVPL